MMGTTFVLHGYVGAQRIVLTPSEAQRTRYWHSPFNKLYIHVHIKLHVNKDNLKSIKLVFKTYLLKQTQMVIEANIGDSKSLAVRHV